MTAKELITLLSAFSPELEVWIEIGNKNAKATDVDSESDGKSVWLVITDYPVDPK